jgi:hypothetical protein
MAWGIAMPTLEGTILITGLPPNSGINISLCFFAVDDIISTPPYGGDPPTEAATDCEKIVHQVDLDRESNDASFAHSFAVERPVGYYYLQVRVLLFRTTRQGMVLAHAEQFFFANRPIPITQSQEDQLSLPISWPNDQPEVLHLYGSVSPQNNRPWWKFW